LVREAHTILMTIREGVDEIGCIMANITLNLYYGGLQEVERLEVALPEDKTAYRGSVRDACPSTSIPDSSMSVSTRPQAFQVHPQAGMMLVLLTPTWILQICHRVERVGVML